MNKNNSISAESPATQQLNDAQRQLIIDNIAFAEKLGTKFSVLGREKGITAEELQQDALLGLCEAALRFDPDKGVSFVTYAYGWCIKFIMMTINGRLFDSWACIYEIPDPLSEETNFTEQLATKVESLIARLTPIERDVICMVYGLPYSQYVHSSEPMDMLDIADLLHLNKVRIQQIYRKAMNKMEFAARKM